MIAFLAAFALLVASGYGLLCLMLYAGANGITLPGSAGLGWSSTDAPGALEWQFQFWVKGCVAFVWTLAITVPLALLVMVLR